MHNGKHMKIKMSVRDLIIRELCRLICITFFLIFITPLGYICLSSIRSFSGTWSLEGYKILLHNKQVLLGVKNSIVLTLLGTMYSLLLEVPTAYVLSKKEYNWLTTIFFCLSQFSVAILPLYLLLKKMKLLNTLWALILPCGFSIMHIHMLRAQLINLSNTLEDAAAVDGAGPIRYLINICIPNIAPAIGVCAFFSASGFWSNTLLAQTVLTDKSKFPLTLVLNQVLIQNQGTLIFSETTGASVQSLQMAEYGLCVLSALPMIILFLFLKKHIKTVDFEGGTVL